MNICLDLRVQPPKSEIFDKIVAPRYGQQQHSEAGQGLWEALERGMNMDVNEKPT